MIAPMESVATARDDTFELTIQCLRGRWSAKFVTMIDGQRHGGIITDANDRSLLDFTNECGNYLLALAGGNRSISQSAAATLALVLT